MNQIVNPAQASQQNALAELFGFEMPQSNTSKMLVLPRGSMIPQLPVAPLNEASSASELEILSPGSLESPYQDRINPQQFSPEQRVFLQAVNRIVSAAMRAIQRIAFAVVQQLGGNAGENQGADPAGAIQAGGAGAGNVNGSANAIPNGSNDISQSAAAATAGTQSSGETVTNPETTATANSSWFGWFDGLAEKAISLYKDVKGIFSKVGDGFDKGVELYRKSEDRLKTIFGKFEGAWDKASDLAGGWWEKGKSLLKSGAGWLGGLFTKGVSWMKSFF